MHSKPSLSGSPAKGPSGALSRPHLKTLHHGAAWTTRGCSNVHGNNATWWTPSGWSAPTKFLKQREGRVTDPAVAASLWGALGTAHRVRIYRTYHVFGRSRPSAARASRANSKAANDPARSTSVASARTANIKRR